MGLSSFLMASLTLERNMARLGVDHSQNPDNPGPTGCGLRSIAMVKLWVKPFWWLRFRSHLFWLVVDLPL